jgi:RNA polymerase sigma factor (sigma-70 family)
MPPGFPDDATLRELQRDLHQFFRRRLPSGCDPRDFVSEVLLSLRNYRGDASINTFAYAVARNMLAEIHRHPNRTDLLDTSKGPPSTEPSPTAKARHRQAAAMLRREVEQLTPEYREAVRLQLDGLNAREIAEQLGAEYNTIRSRLIRGLAQLRERFAGRRDSIEL